MGARAISPLCTLWKWWMRHSPQVGTVLAYSYLVPSNHVLMAPGISRIESRASSTWSLRRSPQTWKKILSYICSSLILVGPHRGRWLTLVDCGFTLVRSHRCRRRYSSVFTQSGFGSLLWCYTLLASLGLDLAPHDCCNSNWSHSRRVCPLLDINDHDPCGRVRIHSSRCLFFTRIVWEIAYARSVLNDTLNYILITSQIPSLVYHLQ